MCNNLLQQKKKCPEPSSFSAFTELEVKMRKRGELQTAEIVVASFHDLTFANLAIEFKAKQAHAALVACCHKSKLVWSLWEK